MFLRPFSLCYYVVSVVIVCYGIELKCPEFQVIGAGIFEADRIARALASSIDELICESVG